jgi:hypothetical protein
MEVNRCVRGLGKQVMVNEPSGRRSIGRRTTQKDKPRQANRNRQNKLPCRSHRGPILHDVEKAAESQNPTGCIISLQARVRPTDFTPSLIKSSIGRNEPKIEHCQCPPAKSAYATRFLYFQRAYKKRTNLTNNQPTETATKNDSIQTGIIILKKRSHLPMDQNSPVGTAHRQSIRPQNGKRLRIVTTWIDYRHPNT